MCATLSGRTPAPLPGRADRPRQPGPGGGLEMGEGRGGRARGGGGAGHAETKEGARSLPSSAAFMVPPAGGTGRKVSPLPQTAAGGPSGNLEGTGKLVLGIHAAVAAAASSRRRSGSWRGEQPPAGSLVGPLPRRHARGRAQRRELWGGDMREVCTRGRPACGRDSPRVRRCVPRPGAGS